MYKQFFGLQDNPFNVTPDPRYLYLTPHTQEALACMTYCVQARKGFALLTGDVGTGKTTLLNKLLEWLRQEQIPSAFVFNPRLNPFQFLDYTLSDFGVNCQSRLKSAILAELNSWLLERYKAGTTAVLIVDEAQDASPELLEEIRLLTNLETPTGKLLQIILAGQVELDMKLRLPEFRQLRQRITLRTKTHPLSLAETQEYVATRLRVAGSDGREIFTREAIEALHHYSEGIPRVINILCEDSLINAYADHKTIISGAMVEAAARELELDIYPATAPPPLEPSPDDILERGRKPERGTSAQRTAAPDRPYFSPPAARAPYATSGAAGPRTAASGERRAERPVPAPGPAAAPATSRDWEESQATTGPEKVEEALKPSPRASASMLPPERGVTPRDMSASDDEILQALRGSEATPKPEPKPPSVKPAPPAAKLVIIPPAPKVETRRMRAQAWLLWVGLLATVILGGVGAILILKRASPSEQAARVSPPVAELTPQPQAPSESPPAAPSAGPVQAPPASITPPAERSVQPESKAEARLPLGPSARRERVLPPAPARAQTAAPAQPRVASDASAVPSVGGMVVRANLEGARITIDGRSSPDWVTPREFSNLPVGPHRVVVSKPGYDDVAGQVIIQTGRTAAFHAQLKAAGGEINIITNPPGLAVSIDGGPFNPSPVQATLGAGTHKYRIQLPNSRIYEGTFEMRAGAIITRRVDFSAGEWLHPTQ